MPKGPAPAYNVAAGHDPLGQPPGERFSGGSRGRYRITVLCAWATGTPFPTGEEEVEEEEVVVEEENVSFIQGLTL